MKKRTMVKLAKNGTVLVMGACVGKVVGAAAKTLMPEGAGRLTKIACHIGVAGITIAATKVINDKFSEAIEEVDTTIAECKNAVEEAKAEMEAIKKQEAEASNDVEDELNDDENLAEPIIKIPSRDELDDLVFDDKESAKVVLDALKDVIAQTGKAPFATLKLACGGAAYPDDFIYGWTDLSTVTVVVVKDGYSINLPKPIQIEEV